MIVPLVLFSMVLATAFAGCPDGYHSYNKGPPTCLKSFIRTFENFDNARAKCREDGGDLVQVHDAIKAQFIAHFHPLTYWMGVWDEHDNLHLKYIDGTPLGSYHPWTRGEPMFQWNGRTCVLMAGAYNWNSGQWDNVSCEFLQTFVCEKKPEEEKASPFVKEDESSPAPKDDESPPSPKDDESPPIPKDGESPIIEKDEESSPNAEL